MSQMENFARMENEENKLRRYAKQGAYVLALSLMPLLFQSDKNVLDKSNTDEIYTEWLVATEPGRGTDVETAQLPEEYSDASGSDPELEMKTENETPNFEHELLTASIDPGSTTEEKEVQNISQTLTHGEETPLLPPLPESKKKIKPLKVEHAKQDLETTIDSLVNALNEQEGVVAKALGRKLAKYKTETTTSIENIPNFKKEKIIVLHFLEREKSSELFAEDPELREMQINLSGMIYNMYKTGVLKDITNPKRDMGLINILGVLGETLKLYENINKDLEKTEKLYTSSRIPVFEEYIAGLPIEQQKNLDLKMLTQDVGLVSTILHHIKKVVEEKGTYFRNTPEQKILKDANENNNKDKVAIMFNDMLVEHPTLIKLFKQLIDDLSKK